MARSRARAKRRSDQGDDGFWLVLGGVGLLVVSTLVLGIWWYMRRRAWHSEEAAPSSADHALGRGASVTGHRDPARQRSGTGAGDQRPTGSQGLRRDATARIADLGAQLGDAKGRIGELTRRVTALETQLDLDSFVRGAQKHVNDASDAWSHGKEAMRTSDSSALSIALRLFRAVRPLLGDRWERHCVRVLGGHRRLLSRAAPEPPIVGRPRDLADAMQMLNDALAYRKTVDAELAALERSLSAPFEPQHGPLLDFIGELLQAADPAGDSCGQRDVMRQASELAKHCGLQLIYPPPGTPFDQNTHQMSAVERRDDMSHREIVRVSAVGFSEGGRVQRKAQVVTVA